MLSLFPRQATSCKFISLGCHRTPSRRIRKNGQNKCLSGANGPLLVTASAAHKTAALSRSSASISRKVTKYRVASPCELRIFCDQFSVLEHGHKRRGAEKPFTTGFSVAQPDSSLSSLRM
jgi:hypothetical protein